MKIKPVSHKLENTFKFESFNTRLSKINVKLLHNIKRGVNSLPSDESNTYFANTLEKWFDLNSSQDFKDLNKSIGRLISVQSLPQLIHRKNELINILIDYLKRENNLALNVVLELIISLGRDLNTDFYQYFDTIFLCLSHLLNFKINSSDSETIENIFICLTFLLKYLSKYIIKEFDKNYKLFSTLLVSKKDYIRKFTSESVSFLIRRAPDKNSIIEVILKSVGEEPKLIEGISYLFFETVKGVNNDFHSCATNFIHLLFNKYLESENENLDKTIILFLKHLLEYISKQNSVLIWDTLLISPESNSLRKVIKLLKSTIAFNNCRSVEKPSKLIQYLNLYLKTNYLDESNKKDILISINILVFNCFQFIDSKEFEELNSSLFFSNYLTTKQIFDFTKSVFNCPPFERLFLPPVLKLCHKIIANNQNESTDYVLCIKFLTELVLTKKQRPIHGINIKNITKYLLTFNEDISQLFLNLLNESNDLQMIWSAFVCLPHLVPIKDKSIIISSIIAKITKLKTNYSKDRWFGYIIVEAVIALILLKKENSIQELNHNFFIELICENPMNTEILNAFDLYLTDEKEFKDTLDLNLLETIYKSLEINFSSFRRVNRLLSLHILTLFDPPLPPSEDIDFKNNSIFNICFSAESVSVNFSEYRLKLKYLQSLEHSLIKHSVPLNTSGDLYFEQMPIHYLFGALFDNFTLLWTPIVKVIETYAKGFSDKKIFLRILFNHLKETTENINSNNNFDSNYYLKDVQKFFDSKLFLSNKSVSLVTERPDFGNHRHLLLKAMDLFPDIIEPSNRDFILMFFEFIQNEMSYRLIVGNECKENIEREEQSLETPMEIDSNEGSKSSVGQKILWKTFFSYLNVLSKFKNPKALYRQKELIDFYLNLLSSPDSETQKNAFNCILSFNSYLLDFKQNFLNLIDEKTFKTEIYSFILNNNEEENNIMNSEHRTNIVPLLMRILYGKLMSATGTKTHNKNSGDYRRSLILKVLSVFDENELILFMDFVFSPILQFIRNDYKTLNQTIGLNIDLKEMISLRRLQSLIRTLNFILKYLGNNSQLIKSNIFKTLIVISTFVSKLLSGEYRNKISDQSITRLKDIRSHCFKVTNNFFNTFDTYLYSTEEIDALFQGLILPLLPNLDTESLSSVSPLLSFMLCLSQNSRYFKILAKSNPSEEYMTPIDVIIKLYDNPKVQTPVINSVTELISNLLILDDFDQNSEHKTSFIEINGLDSRFNSSNERSLGTTLLLPFASQILNRIRLNFELRKSETNIKKKKKNSSFTEYELNILSSLTPFITRSDESLTLSLLLINSMNSNLNEEQKELQTLRALSHLVPNITSEVNQILNPLTLLFGRLANCNSRTELCHLLKILFKNDSNLTYFSKLISDINAFNPRFPEEPDYPKRIDGFKTINSELQSEKPLKFEIFALILHNCIHFIKSTNDLSIRESASNTIKNVLKKLEQMDDNHFFNTFAINLLLYSTISKEMRNESEIIRHEFIELLLYLIEISGERHPILQQLALLRNKEDEEIDFWLNIKHIQIHRRTRALNRLIRNDILLKQLSNRIFSDFLIPLTTNFLNENYKKHTSIVNSAIEAIGVFSKSIQWSKYYFILKYYINRLITQKGEQKLNIKIITSILDNFSFIDSIDSNEMNILNKLEEKDDNEVEEENDQEMNFEENEDQNIINSEKQMIGIRTKTSDKIYDSTLNRLLPLLQKVLHQKSGIDFAYDSMKSEYSEDDDIQRVSIGLAIIKLLKSIKADEEITKTNVSSVFLRLCQFLQSRAQSIRDSARNTFVKVIQSLGPKYVFFALKQMKAILSKGYQRHVFVYTLHSILAELKPQLKVGDLDNCLDLLVEVCFLELFGNLSEEKEVTKITSKLKEAKKSKSFDIFEIMATFVSKNCLNQLLKPLKNRVLEANSHKVLRKASQSLTKIGRGFTSNSALNEEALILFIYDTINEVILESQQKNSDSDQTKDNMKLKRPDSFLITKPIYQRTQKISKIGETSNSYVLIEFGLNCFLALTKQKRLNSNDETLTPLLDQLIPLLTTILDSKDSNLTTLSLQSLYFLYTKFVDLSAFKIYSQNIMKILFVLLHKYAKFGFNDRDDTNSQMIVLCFKTLSLFIEERTDITLNDDQMAVLLSYIEQDLSSDSCQTNVFIILKSILSRKYNSMTFQRIMKRVSEMAVISQNDSTRNNCCQLCIKYLSEYPTNNLKKRINFFIKHLEYETIAGRESALNVVKSVIVALDSQYIGQNVCTFFVPLSTRLVNEWSSDCKKSIADSIIKLLKRINESERNMLFNDLIIGWFHSNSVLQKLLASHLCTLYLTVENKDFFKRLPKVLPLLQQQLDPLRYKNKDKTEDENSRNEDNLIYQHLNLFLKLMKTDSQIIKKTQFLDDINLIFEHLLTYHVLHPHLWIRVICTQIFGQLFSVYSAEDLAKSIDNPKEKKEFILNETEDVLQTMASKFCLLFRDIYESEVLSDQLIKNLVYTSRVFICWSKSTTENINNKSLFKWILNKLIFEVKYELKQSPNINKKRSLIFKWMAAVAVELGSQHLEKYILNFLPFLCREETNPEKQNEENEVLILVKQVLQLIKSIIGTEKFSEYYTKVRTELISKKIERKKYIAIQSVNEVVKSSKRKISKHNRNKLSKKRKINEFKQK